tara:strand:+ start:169 stop:456 length:288 start_codon:yes stop_codon:yes gene_type:complete
MPRSTKVTLILDGEKNNFSMDSDDNILDEGLSNGYDMPHSCQGGICLTCLGKVTEGKAIMDDPGMLSDEELDEGFILTCIARPGSDEITIDFDDV